MSRQISCLECGISLGEIRDATLRKNIAHLCNACVSNHSTMKTQIQLLIARSSVGRKDDFMGAFGDIFGDWLKR